MYKYNSWYEKKAATVSYKSVAGKFKYRSDKILASMLVAGLLILTLYMAVFSQPAHLDPALGATGHGNHAMYHSVKFTVSDSQHHPAPGAIVTVGDQQLVADGQGEIYFGHLLHTQYESTVVYNNQHYRQIVSVYNTDVKLQLDAMSLDFRRFVATASLLLLAVVLGWLLLNWRVRPAKTGKAQSPGTLAVGFAASLVLVGFAAVFPLFASPFVVQAASGTVLDTLPVPANIKIEQDDNNAIVSWNGGTDASVSNPDGITGYKVSWGVSGQPLANISYTQYRIIQLQPLTNGQPYALQIQSVDMQGNLSPLSAVYNFTGDDSRVKQLRQTMNGFFDDFNLPAGGFDERKWNEAYSFCNDPSLSAFFINNQFHSHNLINDVNCDRGQSVSRPRQLFDFANRTGTVTFDFDGSFDRDFWYLDFMPTPTDITGHIQLDEQGEASGPVNMLRIRQNGQDLKIIYIDRNGLSNILAKTDFGPYPTLDAAGFQLISNVRRHWAVKVSQSRVEVQINGKTVLASNANLPFNKAYLNWTQFSYNTSKENHPYNLIHWDNFGFDAPANFKPATITYNYRTPNPGGGDFMDVNKDTTATTTTIDIPDKIAGAKETRLLFTMQTRDSYYEWAASDSVIVNGITFAIPKPQNGPLPLDRLVSVSTPYAVVFKLPPGTLRQGQNTLEFKMLNSGVLNIHAEFDFDISNAPQFTPSYQINKTRAAIPTMPDVGPGARIDEINKTQPQFDEKKVLTISGVAEIKISADNDIALQATGKNPGLSKIELMLGQDVLYKEEVAPTPAYNKTIKLDTTRYLNGQYQLFVRAYNVYGTLSVPDYFEVSTKAGDYYPVLVNIQNSTQGALSVKPIEVTPTPGAADADDNNTQSSQAQATAVAVNSNTPVSNVNTVANPNPGAVVGNPIVTQTANYSWLYWLAGGLYLTVGAVSWGFARQRLRAGNPQGYLPLISLDYLIIWPFYLLRGRMGRKSRQSK